MSVSLDRCAVPRPRGEIGGEPVPERVELAGVSFDNLTEAVVIERIFADIGAGAGGSVVTPNIDILRAVSRSADLKRLVSQTSLVVADGMPLLWAARLRSQPLAGQVAGSNLIFSVSAVAARRDASIFLLGGSPGVAAQAGRALQKRFPGLVVAGSSCPPMGFEQDPAELAALRSEVQAAKPDIVFCGLGFPKQERLAQDLRAVLPSAWFIGCGGALSFAAGRVPRAPRWMQRSGLEWVHRLALEPRRLFRRYIVDDLPFALLLLMRSALPTRRRAGA